MRHLSPKLFEIQNLPKFELGTKWHPTKIERKPEAKALDKETRQQRRARERGQFAANR